VSQGEPCRESGCRRESEGGQTFQQSAKRDRSAEIHCALEILAAIGPIRQSWRGFSHAAAPRAGLTLDGSGHETTHVVTLQQQEQDQARDGHRHDASLRGTVVDGAHRLLPQVGHRERQGLLCAVG
jgi:hypothetical protein